MMKEKWYLEEGIARTHTRVPHADLLTLHEENRDFDRGEYPCIYFHQINKKGGTSQYGFWNEEQTFPCDQPENREDRNACC